MQPGDARIVRGAVLATALVAVVVVACGVFGLLTPRWRRPQLPGRP